MKLEKYDVILAISVPGEPETEVKVALREVPREKLPTVKVPLAGLLEMFEDSIVDEDDDSK